LDEFSARYPIPIGLSDHSGTVYPGFYGISTSIAVLELHVTFSKELFGPDISSSVSFEDLRILTKFNSAMGEMKSHPVDKDEVANDLSNMRSLFTRSVGVRESLSAGTVITRDMLIGRKPGTGVPFEQRDSFVGRRLKSDVSLMRLLSFDDLES
jgi:N-acetylneuraminate synthase